jgi:glycine betaine/proline transport system permease protein
MIDIPLGSYIEIAIEWMNINLAPFFDAVSAGTSAAIGFFNTVLQAPPSWLMLLFIAALAWRLAGYRVALFSLAGLFLVDGMGLWPQTMQTLALVLSATVIAVTIGIPLGVWAARSDLVSRIVRPILDFMQTMPAFVYLIPAVLFFRLGQVPGVIATVIFAMPPVVRLTNFGIRGVSEEAVEAGRAFGASDSELLFKVQLPLATPTILAGVNQTIMLALSMVVIAAMIGAGGLGQEVLKGIEQLRIGLGFESGLAVVILAIVIDRITQALGGGK